MSQSPLWDAIVKFMNEYYDRYHTPGHAGGEQGPPKLTELLGQALFKADLTELPGLDDLHAPESVIKQAQDLAAQTFGADFTYFLVNGSTAGILAMIMASVKPHEKILIPRNAHRSVYHGLILSGGIPVYLPVDMMPHTMLPLNVRPELVSRTLNEREDISAVLVTNPSYYGVSVKLNDVRLNTDLPLLIDEAHGAHFKFSTELPPDASEYGADIWVQSTHKTLGSLTQSSMIHGKGDRVSKERLALMLQLIQTTSPSYPLMVSLDTAREYVEENQTLWESFVSQINELRSALTSIEGIDLFPGEASLGEGFQLDPTKLVIDVKGLGLTGYQVAGILQSEYYIQVELANYHMILLIITPYHSPRVLWRLAAALRKISWEKKRHQENNQFVQRDVPPELPGIPQGALSPREAVYRQGEYVPLKKSIGRVAKEFVIPYPPGIPVLVPGEVVTEEIYFYLRYLMSMPGVHFQGFSHYSSGYLQVVT